MHDSQNCPGLLSDSYEVRTHNPLVRKRTLHHLAHVAKWLSVRLRTKGLWVRISMLSCYCLLLEFLVEHGMNLKPNYDTDFCAIFQKAKKKYFTVGLIG